MECQESTGPHVGVSFSRVPSFCGFNWKLEGKKEEITILGIPFKTQTHVDVEGGDTDPTLPSHPPTMAESPPPSCEELAQHLRPHPQTEPGRPKLRDAFFDENSPGFWSTYPPACICLFQLRLNVNYFLRRPQPGACFWRQLRRSKAPLSRAESCRRAWLRSFREDAGRLPRALAKQLLQSAEGCLNNLFHL